MKKTYAFLAAVCLLMSLIISVQSPVNMTNDFVLNGNALSEDKGFEQNIGMQYTNNQTIIEDTCSNIKEQVSEQITNTTKDQGDGKSFAIKYTPLSENKVKNIGVNEEYVKPQQTPKPAKPIVTTKPAKSNIVTNFDKNAENVKALGEFKFTAYCPCYSCSEGYGTNTATGKKAQENRTIAVDPKVIPYGTTVIIEINGVYRKYIAEDCGGAIKNKKIDIYFNEHSDTRNFGVRRGNVYIITE